MSNEIVSIQIEKEKQTISSISDNKKKKIKVNKGVTLDDNIFLVPRYQV